MVFQPSRLLSPNIRNLQCNEQAIHASYEHGTVLWNAAACDELDAIAYDVAPQHAAVYDAAASNDVVANAAADDERQIVVSDVSDVE